MSEPVDRPGRRATARLYIDRPIRVKARIFLLVFAVALVIAIVDAVRLGGPAWLFVLAGLVAGGAVGMFASRMTHLRWDGFARKVVGRIDAIGAVVLVLYLLFSVFRSRIVDLWVHGPVGGATSVAVLAGVMAGQVLGIRYGLKRMYQAWKGAQPPE
ncbi:hypothetical protein CFN78_19245 [Amycolatopsis antarctica]|uniref:DUF1453 domain-containing protein n=1 Tax=Amycolatopsis antarctica TaxID=1854586 RepID=A0A263CZP7_9PSEU|nr:hypothetical protein [Amycolatopsis antarctica]OZM71654.1 hypothetical protein CFN78_19245 [Amycolatopsis antarctica]